MGRKIGGNCDVVELVFIDRRKNLLEIISINASVIKCEIGLTNNFTISLRINSIPIY
jgi:hypothetical protein